MIVYDKNGKAHDKEPIDAKECVERLGWTTEPPKPVETVEANSGDDAGTAKGSKK